MNSNTKNPQMEHCPCPKYGMIYRPNLYSIRVRKKHLKNVQEFNVYIGLNTVDDINITKFTVDPINGSISEYI